jgi:prepilin-type N-terminal cleavage/methylation domain-containing protein
MRLLRLRTSQRGDTIIEVLISITVIALVMGMAYGTAGRALATTRSSQERLEALKLAEGQIERIKAQHKAAGATADIFAGGTNFYLDGSVQKQTAPYTVGLYKVAIARSACAAAQCYQFDIAVTWERVNTGESQALHLSYRLYAL